MSHCRRCRRSLDIYKLHRDGWKQGKWMNVLCRGCGASHATLNGEVEVIGPAVCALEVPHRRLSPWHLHYTRPVDSGWYECRFDQLRVCLYWDGRNFKDGEKIVSTRTLSGWRGGWL